MLGAAGWAVQDARAVNLAASRGVAVREFVLKPPHGRADYLLFRRRTRGRGDGGEEGGRDADRGRVAEREVRRRAPGRAVSRRSRAALPFVYESTGTETRFTNSARSGCRAAGRCSGSTGPRRWRRWIDELRGIRPRRRCATVFATLPDARADRACGRRRHAAIRNLEESLAANRPRALIQMATGSGKTFTAANVAYRLVKHADARRILFLVDRANLGRQTLQGVPGVHDARTTGASSPSSTTSST